MIVPLGEAMLRNHKHKQEGFQKIEEFTDFVVLYGGYYKSQFQRNSEFLGDSKDVFMHELWKSKHIQHGRWEIRILKSEERKT